jgi:hypothetical protein
MRRHDPAGGGAADLIPLFRRTAELTPVRHRFVMIASEASRKCRLARN